MFKRHETTFKQITFGQLSDDKEMPLLKVDHENPDLGVNSVSKFSSQYASTNRTANYPTTPAGKLALPDLIGMVDLQTIQAGDLSR